MADVDLRLSDELRRVTEGPRPDEMPGGIGTVRFVARCPSGASEVLESAKSVLRAIDEAALMGWPKDHEWQTKLPDWFVARCAPEMTQEEAERWLAWWKSPIALS